MKYHYLDSDGQKAGPSSLFKIRTLSSNGEIPADPQVCPEGDDDWIALSTISPKGNKPSSKKKGSAKKFLPFAGTFLADWVGKLLGIIRNFLTPALVENSLILAKYFGQYAVLLGGLLGFVAAIVAAIRLNSFGIFLSGLGFIVALAVAQFAAVKFLNASDNLIDSTPSRLSSLAFLDCIGLLTILAAFIVLIGGIVGAIKGAGVSILIIALVSSALLAIFSAVSLHPELASVESGSASAGEEAIGILAFFLKGLLKLVPLVFALFAVVGALILLVGMFAPRSNFVFMLGQMLPTVPIPGLGGPGLSGLAVVLTATLVPIISYFMFLIASLPLELWRAVLSLPGKLDGLKR
jgi:hypothetical protein